MSSRQQQPQAPHSHPIRDIEAAIHTIPPPPNRNLNSQQQPQQDGDPFHRRTSAGTTSQPQQQQPQHMTQVDMEALVPCMPSEGLGNSVRSGNYSNIDTESIAASSRPRNGMVLPSSTGSNGKLPPVHNADPRLLHPYVCKPVCAIALLPCMFGSRTIVIHAYGLALPF
jgi:hypothetical protein